MRNGGPSLCDQGIHQEYGTQRRVQSACSLHVWARQSCCVADVPTSARWLWKLQEEQAAIVVVECGGGLAIPSVRVQGEAGSTWSFLITFLAPFPYAQDAVDGGGKGSRLIRINPVHCKVLCCNSTCVLAVVLCLNCPVLDVMRYRPRAELGFPWEAWKDVQCHSAPWLLADSDVWTCVQD